MTHSFAMEGLQTCFHEVMALRLISLATPRRLPEFGVSSGCLGYRHVCGLQKQRLTWRRRAEGLSGEHRWELILGRLGLAQTYPDDTGMARL